MSQRRLSSFFAKKQKEGPKAVSGGHHDDEGSSVLPAGASAIVCSPTIPSPVFVDNPISPNPAISDPAIPDPVVVVPDPAISDPIVPDPAASGSISSQVRSISSPSLSCPSSPLKSPNFISGDEHSCATFSPPAMSNDSLTDDSISSPTSMALNLSPASSVSDLSLAILPSSPNIAGTSDATIDVSSIDDIGVLLRSMPQSTIRNLPPRLKYSLFVNHFRPSNSYKFPSRYVDGCNRSCQHPYFVNNPWFVYSKIEDGIFCLPCVLFATIQGPGHFVAVKFDNWSRKTRKFAEHNGRAYHKLSLVRMEALKSSMTNPTTSIDNRLMKVVDADIAKNRFIIESMIKAVLFCGRQCIALRGHRDDSTAPFSCNKGNFLALLDYSVHSGNTMLERHLKECGRNAVYTSKTIQNELIACIGDHIRDGILNQVKEAQWYSILCDEVTDISVKEQMSVVLRFVNSSGDIREEFVDFIYTDRITGEALASKLQEALVKYGLELRNCRGQGYDGASNMSSAGGVQGILSALNPRAVYMHCNAHILNLCIVEACSLTFIKNMNSTVTETAYFFSNSAKRQAFLEKVVDNQTTTVKVKDLCRTRWAYRHEAYENFYKLFKYLVTVMELIVSRDNEYGNMDWDSNTVITANGFLKVYTTFSFIVSFVVAMNAMAIIKPISIKLQSEYYDIVKAYSEVKAVIEELQAIRGDSTLMHVWYTQAEKVAEELNVSPQVPRTTGRQRHRDNVEHSSVEEYYRRSIVIPLLDGFIQQMNERFSKTQTTVASLLGLVPSVLCTNLSVSLDSLASFYEDDLPNAALVSSEAWRWRTKWLSCEAASRPPTLQKALKACDKLDYPNIHALLRIGCTLPVTSCENERANSTLKNLKSCLRGSMGQERLSCLALMHIHYDKTVDNDRIIDLFKLKSSRRIKL